MSGRIFSRTPRSARPITVLSGLWHVINRSAIIKPWPFSRFTGGRGATGHDDHGPWPIVNFRATEIMAFTVWPLLGGARRKRLSRAILPLAADYKNERSSAAEARVNLGCSFYAARERGYLSELWCRSIGYPTARCPTASDETMVLRLLVPGRRRPRSTAGRRLQHSSSREIHALGLWPLSAR